MATDMFQPEHIVKFYKLLGGGLKDAGWMREHMSRDRLAILPDLTHYEIFLRRSWWSLSFRFSMAKTARSLGPIR
jgi:hypothetical protein